MWLIYEEARLYSAFSKKQVESNLASKTGGALALVSPSFPYLTAGVKGKRYCQRSSYHGKREPRVWLPIMKRRGVERYGAALPWIEAPAR